MKTIHTIAGAVMALVLLAGLAVFTDYRALAAPTDLGAIMERFNDAGQPAADLGAIMERFDDASPPFAGYGDDTSAERAVEGCTMSFDSASSTSVVCRTSPRAPWVRCGPASRSNRRASCAAPASPATAAPDGAAAGSRLRPGARAVRSQECAGPVKSSSWSRTPPAR